MSDMAEPFDWASTVRDPEMVAKTCDECGGNEFALHGLVAFTRPAVWECADCAAQYDVQGRKVRPSQHDPSE